MAKTARQAKISLSILCGLMVTLIALGIHLATVGRDINFRLIAIGDLIAGMTAIIVCLAIQLRQEEIHYQTAMDRAAIVAELNHHVRNAIFPLCLAVQNTGNEDAIKTSNDAVERINIALKDATADAMSGRVDYQTYRTNGSSG